MRLWWILAVVATGCSFAPSLAGRYACGVADACPPGLVCAADRICRERVGDAGAASSDFASTGVDLGPAATPDLSGVSLAADLSQPGVATDLASAPSDLAAMPPDLAVTPPDFATSPMDLAIKPMDFAMKPMDFATTPPDFSSACVPVTACGNNKECGDRPDGCGGVVHCGNTCKGKRTCGGGGIPNQCG